MFYSAIDACLLARRTDPISMLARAHVQNAFNDISVTARLPLPLEPACTAWYTARATPRVRHASGIPWHPEQAALSALPQALLLSCTFNVWSASVHVLDVLMIRMAAII